jgi:hypothetical protein
MQQRSCLMVVQSLCRRKLNLDHALHNLPKEARRGLDVERTAP